MESNNDFLSLVRGEEGGVRCMALKGANLEISEVNLNKVPVRGVSTRKAGALLRGLTSQKMGCVSATEKCAIDRRCLKCTLRNVESEFVVTAGSVTHAGRTVTRSVRGDLRGLHASRVRLCRIRGPDVRRLSRIRTTNNTLRTLRRTETTKGVKRVNLATRSIRIFTQTLRLS